MITNKLLYLSLFFVLPWLLVSCSQQYSDSSVLIHATSATVDMEKGVVSYTFLFSSKDGLKSLKVTPSILGTNVDSQMEYHFEDGAYYAALEYFYVIPEGLNLDNGVTLTVELDGNTSSITQTESFRIEQAPIWASQTHRVLMN